MAIIFSILAIAVFLMAVLIPFNYKFSTDHTCGTMLFGAIICAVLLFFAFTNVVKGSS